MGKALNGNLKEILGTRKVFFFQHCFESDRNTLILGIHNHVKLINILQISLGLYSDQTRGVYLLCLLLEAIQPLGWKLVSSADISSKNLDANERGYSLVCNFDFNFVLNPKKKNKFRVI